MFKEPSNKAILIDKQAENHRSQADKNDKGRFILSKKTQVEFGLHEADIPDNMKEVLPQNRHYTDFVSRNVRIPSM